MNAYKFQLKHIIIAIVSVIVGVALMFYIFTDKHVHKWGEWQTTKLTSCTVAGEHVRVCTDKSCHEREYEEIPAVGEHVFSAWTVGKVPTCTEDGYQQRTCGCGEAEYETIAAKGHNFFEGVCRRCYAMQDAVEGN